MKQPVPDSLPPRPEIENEVQNPGTPGTSERQDEVQNLPTKGGPMDGGEDIDGEMQID